MRCLLQLDGASRQSVQLIVEVFLQKTATTDLMGRLGTHSVMKPILVALEKITCWCRCIANLLSLDGLDSSTKDVMFFLDYKGKSWFEKSMSVLLSKTGSYWSNLANEAVRTAGSAEVLRPKKHQLHREIKSGAFLYSHDAVTVQQAVVTYLELKQGMRESELEAISQDFFDMLTGEATRIIALPGPTGLSSTYVDAIIRGLNAFTGVPGSLSLVKDLTTWMTTQRNGLAVSDFSDLFHRIMQDDDEIDFGEIKNSMAKLGGCELNDACYEKMDRILLRMHKQIQHQAHQWGGGSRY